MPTRVECETICTALAGSGAMPIVPVSGLCQFQAQGHTISDVVITGCAVQQVSFQPVAGVPRGALMTVSYDVHFDYTAAFPEGASIRESAVCSGTVQFIQLVTPSRSVLLTPPQCMPDLHCRATDGGFDPATGTQYFVVLVFGSVDCVSCSSQRVVENVQLCSGAPLAEPRQDAAPGAGWPPRTWPRA